MVDLYNAGMPMDEEPEMALTMEEFEEAREELNHTIQRGEAAKRLGQNPDFKLLVLEGYFDREAKRNSDLMTTGKLTKSVLEGCADNLAAIGKCRLYFKDAVEQGNLATQELAALEQARDEALEAASEGETQAEV